MKRPPARGTARRRSPRKLDVTLDELREFVESRVWYQSYEFLAPFGVTALSSSEEKLQALRLPDLAGKTVLDLGCNAGFLTFRCLELGAAVAVGVDWDETFVETAVKIGRHIRREPRAIFVRDEVNHFLSLVQSSFDIVICASIGHYLDLPALFRRLEQLGAGLLALELPYVPGSAELHVARGGKIVIPGDRALERLAAGHGFACERVGESEKLDQDERAVFHFRGGAPTRRGARARGRP